MWREISLMFGYGQHQLSHFCTSVSCHGWRWGTRGKAPTSRSFFSFSLPLRRTIATVVSQKNGARRKADRNGDRVGSHDSSTSFDEWLKANPLPDMAGPTHLPDRAAAVGKFESYMAKQSPGESWFDLHAERGMKGEESPCRLQRPRKFSWQETGDLLYESLCHVDGLQWDCQLGRFLEVNPPPGKPRMEFLPPFLQSPPFSGCTPNQYLQILQERRASGRNKQLVTLLSSSAAAMGIFKDGSLLAHKVITAYTVRAKQGKSQLKYLRQGGPGRMTVGGALRAKESARFFNRVCEKFDDWAKEIEGCEALCFSGTTRVWNEVYWADPTMVVPRDDERWHKIPFSIHEPRFRELLRVFYRLSHGLLFNARW